MIIKRENDKIIIDFKNDIIHTYNDTAINFINDDNKNNGDKLEITNLHIVGSYGYSQLNLVDKFKLLYTAFKTIFLNKEC